MIENKFRNKIPGFIFGFLFSIFGAIIYIFYIMWLTNDLPTKTKHQAVKIAILSSVIGAVISIIIIWIWLRFNVTELH